MRISRKYRQKAREYGLFGRFGLMSAQFPPDIEEFLPSLLAYRIGIEAAELAEGLLDRLSSRRDHGGSVAVSAADGLLQDGVDHPESQHVLGGDLHAVGGFLGFGAVAPEDRGGRFR